MTEETYGFASTRTRLEEIVAQVRKKDTSLEKSLDLLEEGVRLANQCTELIDHADWDAAAGAVAQVDASAAGEIESEARDDEVEGDEDGSDEVPADDDPAEPDA